MSAHNGECPYGGSCKCEAPDCPCKSARRREEHYGRHSKGCHLECRGKPGKGKA